MLSLARLLVAAALSLVASAALAAPVTAHIDSGALRGVQADGVSSFKAIPFAAPPVGALRWRAPQAPARWSGERAADQVGSPCMQKLSKDNGVGRETPNEDCLTVNVWTPDLKPKAKLPMMVWIHGGGFINGSGTALLYDGTELAKQGVVLVTINYRLGWFGFLAHPDFVYEAKGRPTANYGMMDMIASLEWVKRNISAFGGDAKNVTIFGESAGGVAVQELMMPPSARGLFSKVICESGGGRGDFSGLNEALSVGQAVAKSMNAASAADLRALTADKIVAASFPSTFKGGGPIIDGKLLPVGPAQGFATGKGAKVPLLIGSNNVEWPANPTTVRATLAGVSPFGDKELPILQAAYPDAANFAFNIGGDIAFTESARYVAGQHAARGIPTILYRFSVLSPSVRATRAGAPHAQERQYVFRTLSASPWATDANDAAQAKTMSAYWVAFAKTGNPNGGGRVAWPAYAAASDRLLEFTNDGPVAEVAPFQERWKAIGGLYAAKP